MDKSHELVDLSKQQHNKGVYPMKVLNWIVTVLVIVGAINWGLVGFFDFNLVGFLFHGTASWASRVVYALVGIAGLFKLKCLFGSCKCCH